MPRKKRLEAKAIERILDAKTREVVGWLYQWNTGGPGSDVERRSKDECDLRTTTGKIR